MSEPVSQASPGEGQPRTIDAPIPGPAATQTFTLPPGVTLDVESVRAVIDTTAAAGPVTAELTIAEQSGVVIASKRQGETIPAGTTGSATWALRLDDEGAAAPTPPSSATLPWCEAFEADYNPADFFFGSSPDPLNYKFFAGNDPTAFAFDNVGIPAANNGFVQILRSGYYRVRLIVSPASLRGGAGSPGYLWDMAVQVRAVDNGGAFYFGPGPAPGSTYYSEGAYALFWNGAPQLPAPNFTAIDYPGPDPAGDVYLNLDDSTVQWPVTIYNQFLHGLNDADVGGRAYYYLQVVRLGDSNPAAFTG